MSQQHQQKQHLQNLEDSYFASDFVVETSTECDSTPHKRRRHTNQALEALGQLIRDSSVNDRDSRLNKNDILSLTLARLLRRKYWPSNAPNNNVHLAAGIESYSMTSDLNGFIVVLNTSGRIILLSDNVEDYLRKDLHSLYPQLTSIYNCVSDEDHEPIRRILSSPTVVEQRVICSWNLPRGKRPSRAHTESKPMLMTGHFFFPVQEQGNVAPLFIARCEQILSSTPNIPTSSLGSMSATILRFVLNDQLNISEVSSNTEALLGYKAEELFDQSINNIIATEYLDTVESTRQNCIAGRHLATMNVLDLYTRSGERLTFLCNTHLLLENRRKPTKFGFLAQLIDPSMRYECLLYANKQNLERLKSTVQQESPTPLSDTNMASPTSAGCSFPPNQDQCVTSHPLSQVCPVTVLPQRRKRRRLNHPSIREHTGSFAEKETSPMINELNDAQISLHSSSSSDSLRSTVSPTQELGSLSEGLFPYFDTIFPEDEMKSLCDPSAIDDFFVNLFDINNHQSFFLTTPTMSVCSFFP